MLRTFALALMLLLVPLAARAERVALVIGNSGYLHANPLPNAAQDARDMAARLTGIGFSVYSGIDLTRAETLSLVAEFSQALQPEDLALFFYAGHGAQVGAENYVIPIDAAPTDEVSLIDASVKLQSILRTMELRSDQRIVILDACRNNPFVEKLASRDVSGGVARGLAKVEAGVGSFIAFSTQPGNVALDGSGKNSPFTTALLAHIGEPGLDIHAVMRAVRADVVTQTNQSQVPWENSSLVSEVFLAGAAPPPEPVSTAQISRPAPTRSVDYHYVGGLDPNGDGFLALRSGTTSSATRLAKMTEGTLLTVLGQSGDWLNVRLQDGREGWAHSNWIFCCVTVAEPVAAPPPDPAILQVLDEGATCDQLWTARNLIWKDYGYCFTTDRAIRAFGNEGCQQGLDRAAITLAPEDAAEVDRLSRLESQLGCN